MEYTVDDVLAALHDPGVRERLSLALRDRAIKRAFREMRRDGMKVEVVFRRLAARAWEGQYLSEERIRSIVYRKGR